MNEPDNNRSDNLMEGQESYSDPYVTESSADIYATPEVVETVEEVDSVEVVDTHGLFSGRQPENTNSDFYTNYSGQSSYGNGQAPYGNGQQGNPYNPYGGQSPYGNGRGKEVERLSALFSPRRLSRGLHHQGRRDRRAAQIRRRGNTERICRNISGQTASAGKQT